jgi:hypothetical protein
MCKSSNGTFGFGRFAFEICVKDNNYEVIASIITHIIVVIRCQLVINGDAWGYYVPFMDSTTNKVYLIFTLKNRSFASYRYNKFKGFFSSVESNTYINSFLLVPLNNEKAIDYFMEIIQNPNNVLISTRELPLDLKS